MSLIDPPALTRAQADKRYTRYGTRLAIFGDSRVASSYPVFTPSAMSVSGQTLTITAPGIGGRKVGEAITIGRSGLDYMRAEIATVVDADNITATVKYPAAGLPSGAIAGGSIVLREARPIYTASYATWLLAMLGQPFAKVDCYGYGGSRIEGAIEYQIRDALEQGFDAAWVHISANNWLTSADDQDTTKIIPMLKRLMDSMAGVPVWFFLETPLGAVHDTATHRTRVAAINAWARTYGNAMLVDLFTPMDDGAGTAKAYYLHDGLHPATKGALNASLYAIQQGMGITAIERSVNLMNANTARFPLADPVLSGSLGPNVPTNYAKAVSGSVVESSHLLKAKADGTGNEFESVVVASGAGSHMFYSAAPTVVAGGKYRFRTKLQIEGGIGVDYVEALALNFTGDTGVTTLFAGSNTLGNGSADGSYVLWMENDGIIPAGVTRVYLRSRVYFDSPGGATITYSDFQMERLA